MHHLAYAMPAALTELLRATPLSDGKVAFAWRAAVGSAMGRATDVRLERRVLHVDTSSAEWEREVSRSAPLILTRLQSLLGDATVSRITVRCRPA